jgi:hypothetical protein
MKGNIRIKVVKQPKPDLRKLARALLLLVEHQSATTTGGTTSPAKDKTQ